MKENIDPNFSWNEHYKTFGLSNYNHKPRKTHDKGPKCPAPFKKTYFLKPVILFDYIEPQITTDL